MAFSSVHSSAARYLNRARRASDNEEPGESQEKCCGCFSLKMGVRIIAIVLSVVWLFLLYPAAIVPNREKFYVYIIYCILNSFVFVLIVVASFTMEARPSNRLLLIPAMMTCLLIAVLGFVFVTALSCAAMVGNPIKPKVPGYGSWAHGIGFISFFLAFPYIYYVVALKYVYEEVTKERSAPAEDPDEREDCEI